MSIGYDFHQSFSQQLKEESFVNHQIFLENRIRQNKPFWIARMSGIESGEIGRYYGHRDFLRVDTKAIQRHSGINIVDEKSFLEYLNMTHMAFSTCDRLAIWDGGCYEQCREMYQICRDLFPTKYTFPAHSYEPFYFMNMSEYRFPRIFENQRILIVTSHATSVMSQISNIHRVFAPYCIFSNPENISVYRTVQQHGGGCDGQDWSIHYEKMCADIAQMEFDVAFIGCGGFSNLLGYFIRKEMNRSAIYVGGGIQLYFGVMGRRWLTNPYIMEFVHRNSESWIVPSPEDYVKGCEEVEQSCYWM